MPDLYSLTRRRILGIHNAEVSFSGRFSMETVFDRVRRVIAKEKGIDEQVIVPGAFLSTDLEISSLEREEIFLAVEDEFNMKISDRQALDQLFIRTVQDIVDFVLGHPQPSSET